jgi:hypothetical protein
MVEVRRIEPGGRKGADPAVFLGAAGNTLDSINISRTIDTPSNSR